MTDKNDLKPGDFARHPKHPELIGTVSCDYSGVLWVNYVGSNGFRLADRDLTDWERVEVVQPGHVQVRVDDLDPQTLSEWSQYTVHSDCDSVLVRTGRAFIGQQVEYNPRCPKRGEKATSATVTLPCPDCGEGITHRVVVRLDPDVFSGGYYLAFEGEYPVTNHRCPPAQPDEPTGLGAVVEVGGKRFVRTDEDGHPWIDNVAYWHTWDEITARGPVTVLSEGLAS